MDTAVDSFPIARGPVRCVPAEQSTVAGGALLPLLRAAQRGDRRATERLFVGLHRSLTAVVGAMCAKRRMSALEDEDDLVQDTCLKAYQHLRSFPTSSESSLLRWLSKLAENNACDALRRYRSQKRGEGCIRNCGDPSLDTAFGRHAVALEPSPPQVAIRDELAEELAEQVARLSERKRRVFVLRWLRGRGFEDIAAELGLAGAGSARSLYSRVVAQLGAQLQRSSWRARSLVRSAAVPRVFPRVVVRTRPAARARSNSGSALHADRAEAALHPPTLPSESHQRE